MRRKFANQFSDDPEERQMYADEQRREAWQTLIGFFIVAGLIVGAVMWFESWRCGSPWRRSGMRTSWGPFQGCLIEAKPGKWIPAERYRETP